MDCTNKACGCVDPNTGRTIPFDQTVQKGDGCNTCKCMTTGQMQCSANQCGCRTPDGTTINFQATFQKDCNTCTCQNTGLVTCTNNICSCSSEGVNYPIGRVFNLVSRPCVECRCQQNGQLQCDTTKCPTPPTPAPVVEVCTGKNGVTYKIGETFKDDCNQCKCQKPATGKPIIACTKKLCGCKDPANPTKIYKAGQTWVKDVCYNCTCTAQLQTNCQKKPGCSTKTGR